MTASGALAGQLSPALQEELATAAPDINAPISPGPAV